MSAVSCAVQQPPPLPPPCTEQLADIARLQQTLVEKEAEITRLRTHQRGQANELRESTNTAARAQVKLRRLATQVDAASAIAQLQVEVDTLRTSWGAAADDPRLLQVQGIQAHATESFAQGEYGSAVEYAAQAGQLTAMMANLHTRSGSARRVLTQVPFPVPIPLRTRLTSNLRSEPRVTSAVLAIINANSPLVAHAYKGHWLLVHTEDGRAGWMYRPLLVAP